MERNMWHHGQPFLHALSDLVYPWPSMNAIKSPINSSSIPETCLSSYMKMALHLSSTLNPQRPSTFHPPPIACKTHPISMIGFLIRPKKCPKTPVRTSVLGASNSHDSDMGLGPKNKKWVAETGHGELPNSSEEERSELVEALESLEEEAIMGEDEGREATDYNRRAHIFDACSKVFQDLKSPGSSSTDGQVM